MWSKSYEMKNIITLILISLSFVIKAQSVEEFDMLNMINEIRINPKSFIPRVEAYIKKLESASTLTFTNPNIKITKSKNDGLNEKLIIEAKDLIVFLNNQKSVRALGFNNKLYHITKKHANYLDSTKTVSHDGPDGETLAIRTQSIGFSVLENVCSVNNANNRNTVIDALLQFLLDYGVANKPHRANLFNEKASNMAVAKTGDIWVQNFTYTLK